MNFNLALCNHVRIRRPAVNHQSLRWLKSRKPFWLGVAKSRKFVVPQPKVVRTQEETKELRRIISDYECQMNSLLNFVAKKNPLLKENNENLLDSLELTKKIEESYLKNNSWNAVSAKLRDERMARNLESFSKNVQSELERIEKSEKENLQRIEKLVAEEKVKSKFFVTPENLDETIERCLNDCTEYNFAIDIRGNKYLGKDPILKLADEIEEIKVTELKEEAIS